MLHLNKITHRTLRGAWLLPGMMALALGLAALCSTAAFAQDVTDPALNGVSRSFIETNGYPAAVTLSARGVNHLGQAQIPLSGFDIVNDGVAGELLLPGVRKLPGGPCNGLSDDAYFLIHVAGRPGDADGDGAFNNNVGLCSHLAPGNTTIDDGNGP